MEAGPCDVNVTAVVRIHDENDHIGIPAIFLPGLSKPALPPEVPYLHGYLPYTNDTGTLLHLAMIEPDCWNGILFERACG